MNIEEGQKQHPHPNMPNPVPPMVPPPLSTIRERGVSPFTLKSLKLHVLNSKREERMTATGFLVEINQSGDVVLVTNFHVVAWRDLDGEHLPSTGAGVPEFIQVELPSTLLSLDGNPGQSTSFWEIDLYDGDRSEPAFGRSPQWYQDGGNSIYEPPSTDLAVFPIRHELADQLHPYTYSWDRAEGLPLSVTDPLFVVGYPERIGTFVASTPIWTRGSVASEPQMDPLDRFFIDSRTRPGQSGSPVIAYRPEARLIGAGPAASIEEMAVLQGVYSGRIDKDADIGSVWTMDAVERLAHNIDFNVYRGQPDRFTKGDNGARAGILATSLKTADRSHFSNPERY